MFRCVLKAFVEPHCHSQPFTKKVRGGGPQIASVHPDLHSLITPTKNPFKATSELTNTSESRSLLPTTIFTKIQSSSGTITSTPANMFALGQFVVAACLATSASGHMTMRSPVPYGKSSLTNSPLDASGSDFPCKLRPGGYDLEGASNVMAIGEPQTLSFTGGATHGGGSCQVSLTTDLQPTKDSKWMVIKSIEGGCPSGFPGNVGSDPQGTSADTFQYTIPEGIAPGEYTIAWSWMNKIGNREFYMNCGPATITGAKKKRYNPNPVVRRQSSFPAMYVANLKDVNSCTTTEGKDYTFPNPGDDTQQVGAGPFEALDAACAGGSASTPAQQPSSSGNDTAPAAAAPSPPVAATGTATGAGYGGSPSTASASAGVFASGAASAEPSANPAAPVASSAAAPQAPASTGSSSGSGSSSSSASTSGSQTAGAPCTDEGAWACSSDNSSFQRCASGTWSVVMQVPAGMTADCSGPNGFAMVAKTGAGKMKRVVRKSDGLFEPYN
jgi:hypothetical protein